MLTTIHGHQVIADPTPEERRFYQLQADWHYSNADGRKAIVEEIARHPEWGFRVTPDGIERGG
jgi:hypothetical protein